MDKKQMDEIRRRSEPAAKSGFVTDWAKTCLALLDALDEAERKLNAMQDSLIEISKRAKREANLACWSARERDRSPQDDTVKPEHFCKLWEEQNNG